MAARPSELIPIVQRSYDLCADLYAHVNRFPRAQKTLLGRVILEDGLQLLGLLTVANRRSDKRETLAEASGRLDALRITVRLSQRLGFLSHGGYARLSEVADEVGRMLGGWLKHEAQEAGAPPARRGGVRYTMTSPTIERYLALKLEHPESVVFVVVGSFCQTFFEDARVCGRELKLAVRNVAADSEPETILTCGFPLRVQEKYLALLRQGGRQVHMG